MTTLENPLKVEETVGTQLMRALFDEISTLRTPWPITPQQQQQEVLDRLRSQVEHAVGVAVNRLATGGFEYVIAEIDSLTIKDAAKVAVTLPRGTQDIHTLADRVKSKVVIVFADVKEYTDGIHVITSQPDQNSLPLDD